jgi:hypothetical protein
MQEEGMTYGRKTENRIANTHGYCSQGKRKGGVFAAIR